MSAIYHIGCSEISGEIYAGTLRADAKSWRDKVVVTDAAIIAVRDHLVEQMKRSGQDYWYGYEWTRKDGKKVVLSVEVK